ncbi:hypothetical protein [Lentzea sp. NBRC 102530]|uniref:hypothetical protein n=1 Tax=Lentzea sp. NBRC 102530 TaxID=3032201 RepID=UPI00249FD055|nr:hypothetical protein [Lentzea sp. NBRC 102530]GLY53684.1 hypothetical protein Lesp01_73400 [Lentzea sp. NBRC 102530]
MQAATGVVLVVWVAACAAVIDVANPRVLLASAVSGGLVCLCAAAGGVVALRLTDVESAVRSRHVFVVLEGVALAAFFPFHWFGFGIEPVGRPGTFAVGAVLALAVPVAGALVLALRQSLAVHKIVVAECGPLAPDSGAGEPLARVRVLSTVLVVVGTALALAAVAVAFAAPAYRWILLAVGLLVTLTPVLLGVRLASVKDVYDARRRNVGNYVVVPSAGGVAVYAFASTAEEVGVLFGAITFGAVVLLVVAMLVVREFSGDWDRPWRADQERRHRLSP